MSENQASTSNSLGFGGALCIMFIGLKLAGVIDWPWVWVLSPIWICLVVIVLAALSIAYYERKKKWP